MTFRTALDILIIVGLLLSIAAHPPSHFREALAWWKEVLRIGKQNS